MIDGSWNYKCVLLNHAMGYGIMLSVRWSRCTFASPSHELQLKTWALFTYKINVKKF
jgi:hypothetical protein